MKNKLLISLLFLSFCSFVLSLNSTDVPIIATWYCSLFDPTKYGYCGNPSANWVADCNIPVRSPPCSGCGIAALNPAYYNQNQASHTCRWIGPACGSCWRLTGVGGSKTVKITDCCAGYANACSCLSCPTNPGCDWCEKGDNWHFDLDIDSFTTVCGSGGVNAGHCQLYSATGVSCP
eukprot:TRINITY_DN9521_c0_g1_i1.p1 TRINITY_DN9521_c0_g1~~TRINITY_DN9521_c0_g1_i1.p1  ORF type:complete len:192 (-),score=29.65 TRINITY_DN9521_c0_g1_i1:73-603(-)